MNCEKYIQEIKTLQKAKEFHATMLIEQYKKTVQSLEELYFEKKKSETILGNLSAAVLIVDKDRNIIYRNLAYERFFQGKSIFEKLRCEELLERSLVLEHGGKYYQVKVERLEIEQKLFYVLLFEDVSEFIQLQKQLQDQKELLEVEVAKRTKELQKLSLKDSLTNLFNRHFFLHALEQALKNEDRYALLFIDLDDFKAINDTFGHDVGDEVLRYVANTILGVVSEEDVVARLGGDEFVVLMRNYSLEEIEKIGNYLLKELNKKIDLQQFKVRVGASIGIYILESYEHSASEVLIKADKAMYEAKKRGKNRYVVFNESFYQHYKQEIELGILLDRIGLKEFVLYIQPIYYQGEIEAYEVLARWIHNGKIISPALFIPLLEKRAMIIPFTYWLLEEVAKLLHRYEKLPRLSVNFSILQFYDGELLEFLERLLQRYPLAKGRIAIEVTESVFNTKPEVVQEKIEKLKNIGFWIYIDDFGTGFSSFSYIKEFNADVVKIDRSFLRDIVEEEKSQKLLAGMVELFETLGIKSCVEGVESKEQLNILQKLDVLMQGFYFSKPVPVEEVLQNGPNKPNDRSG